MRKLHAREHWFADMVVLLCGYEVIAIITQRVPTLTALQRKHRLLGPVIILGLAVHFYNEDLKILNRFRTVIEAVEDVQAYSHDS